MNSGDPFPSQWDPHGGPRKTKGLWALEYHIFRIDHLSNTFFLCSILYSKGLWALEYHIFRIDHLANTYFGFKGAVGLKVSHFPIF